MNVSNKYYRTYDANNKSGDFDDHDVYLNRNVTGKTVLNELTKGDPFSGIVKLVNIAKQNKIQSELTNILEGSTNIPLDSIIGRLVNQDNYKFQYGINDLLVDPSKTLFRSYVDKIEDPTILTFTMEIDENNSPLYQSDIEKFIILRKEDFPSEAASFEGNNLIVSSNIGGLYDRTFNILDEFRRKVREFFAPYQSNTGNYSKSYYITSVGGIADLDKVYTISGDDAKIEFAKLKFKMREDVKLSARNLYFLFNSLKMHRRSGKLLIPENLLRFNLWIKISEIRNFTSLRFAIENGANQDVIDAIKRDVTAIYYYVQDCNFDFSKLHKETYSVDNTLEYEDLDFEIAFRRAHRVFKPTLLKAEQSGEGAIYGIDERTASVAFNKKNYPLGNFNGLNVGDAVRPSLMPELNQFVRQSDPVNSRTKETTSSKDYSNIQSISQNGSIQSTFQSLGKFLSTGKINLNPNNVGGLEGKALNLASQAVTKLAQSAKNTVIQKRNQLVRDLENKVKNTVGFGVPRPKNIYKPGEGSGIIGNTLQSLSKATGIDFLSIREGRNIQSFSNTDVQTLNPALEGRNILTGPGSGDYSDINPNNAKTSEIANVQPHVNSAIVPPNNNVQPNVTVTPDTSILKNIEPVTPLVVDTSILKNVEPVTPLVIDTSVLINIEPVTPTPIDTSLLQNIEPASNFKPDTSVLNKNLQQGPTNVPDTSVLQSVEPRVNNIMDTTLLNTNLQQGLGSTNDPSTLTPVEPKNVKSPNNVNVLNVNLQPKPATVTERVSFKNIYVVDPVDPVVQVKKDELTKIDTTVTTVEKMVERNINTSVVDTTHEELTKIDTTLAKIEEQNIDNNVNPIVQATDKPVLGKIDTSSDKNKPTDLTNVNK